MSLKTGWDEVLARLDRVDAAVRESLSPTPERVRAVLDDRARALAVVPPQAATASELIEVAVFTVGGECYGVEARFVRRVLKSEDRTPVPGTPAALLGVINLGGEVLAVFDLPAAFGAGRGSPSGGPYVVVLGDGRDELGVAADAVDEVRSLRAAELLEPPVAAESFGRDLLLGLTADALLVLDGAALLADPRLVIDQGEDACG